MTAMKGAADSQLVFAGIPIDRLGWDESLDAVMDSAARQATRVMWVYANCINIARRHTEYRTALRESEFVLSDGAGIALAGRVFDRSIPANLCGTDWIPALLDRLRCESNRQHGIFFLGTRPDILADMVALSRRRWPELEVVGSHDGFFSDDLAVVQAINRSGADILIVAMGVPRQELFVARHWQAFSANGIRLAICGGAVMDYLTGHVSRAPLWLRQLHGEWLYRLITEPRRLWRRYLLGNVRFLADLRVEWVATRRRRQG